MFTEMAEGIYRLESIFGGRNLYLYLLAGDDFTVLIDSGAAESPENCILPALQRLGLGLDLLVVTHCDLDHQGGNARLRAEFPGLQIACGAGDEIEVSDPRELVSRRYGAFEHDHGVGFPTEVKPHLMALAGQMAAPVDRTFCGGEELRLSLDWTVRVLHVPGHSRGHLAIFDPRSGLCITQDAVQGSDYPFADGRPWALMPTYYLVEPYLQTVADLERLAPASLLMAHWPTAEGQDVDAWLEETRSYTTRADGVVFDVLTSGKDTLAGIMEVAMPLLGKWDGGLAGDFAASVSGHLQRFCDAGIARTSRRDGKIHYEAIGSYEPPIHTSDESGR